MCALLGFVETLVPLPRCRAGRSQPRPLLLCQNQRNRHRLRCYTFPSTRNRATLRMAQTSSAPEVTHVAPMKRRALEYGCREFSCLEPEYAHFRPNLSPGEVLQAGAFGGTYFRDIAYNRKEFKDAWKEFASPATDWFDGLDIETEVASQGYRPATNRHKVKSGQTLDVWLEKGWISEYDSHGWFHWYCRFFLGRRCADDERQIGRWGACCGQTGRWRRNLIAKCVRSGKAFDDYSVSPVVRQTLLHWAYELTEKDYNWYARQVRAGVKTSFIPNHTMRAVVAAETAGGKRVKQNEAASSHAERASKRVER